MREYIAQFVPLGPALYRRTGCFVSWQSGHSTGGLAHTKPSHKKAQGHSPAAAVHKKMRALPLPEGTAEQRQLLSHILCCQVKGNQNKIVDVFV